MSFIYFGGYLIVCEGRELGECYLLGEEVLFLEIIVDLVGEWKCVLDRNGFNCYRE